MPLFQTLAWIAFVAVLLFLLRGSLPKIIKAIVDRVAAGDPVVLRGPGGTGFELGERVAKLERVEPSEPAAKELVAQPPWTAAKKELSAESRGIFLAHVIGPSSQGPGWAEVYVYLVGHRRARAGFPDDQADVVKAEFYLGRHWGGRVFEITRNPDGITGLRTTAYGPVLCICRIHFNDGHTAVLNRYLDFEMAGVIGLER